MAARRARRDPAASPIGRGPVANENAGNLRRRYAPWPLVDRYPIILGSNLTISYIAAVLRIARQGYRQQLVDVLRELLEKDPHTFAVVAQRVLAVAGGRVELVPAPVADPDSPDAKRAKEIRDDLQRRLDAIPQRTQALHALLFSGLFYGAGAFEAIYDKRADGWWINELVFIHSRRIAWPDQDDWSPHIWDQGSVGFGTWGAFPTEGFYGLRIQDTPRGKIILHTPQLHADYPTGEGLGLMICFWMAIKLMAIRGAGQYVERYGKPWAIAYYNTVEPNGTAPRVATGEGGEEGSDIQAANRALTALAAGSLSGVVLPDSIKVTLDGPGVKGATGGINHEKLINLCDEQISKAVRGGTLTTDAGEKGARSLGEVHEEGDVRNARYDAKCLEDTLDRDLVWALCHLNHPGEEHLCPSTTIHVEKLSPEQLLERALKLAASGAPVDGRKLADALGVPLIDENDPKAIRLAPLKPTDLFALLPSSAQTLPAAIEALATIAGVTLPPAIKTAIAEMDRDDAARLVQSLIGAAKAVEKSTSEAGVGAETGSNTPPKPGENALPEGGEPPPKKKTSKPRTKRAAPVPA